IAVRIDSLAIACVLQEDPERAAALLGSGEAIWARMKMPATEYESYARADALNELWIETRREGVERYSEAFARGKARGLGEAVEFALSPAERPVKVPAAQPSALADSGLTPREIQVVGFLGDGLSNREIAAALSL